MKLLYFTESYPYGIGEEWKTNELTILSDYFDEILVVPFHFGGNKNPINLPAENVKATLPLFDEMLSSSWRSSISLVLTRPVLAGLECWRALVKGRAAFANYRQSATKIWKLMHHAKLRSIMEGSYDLAYFFWGRHTVELMSISMFSMPVALRLHGYDLYKWRWAGNFIPFQDRVLKKATSILAISNEGKEYLEQEWNIAPDRIHVSRLGTLTRGRAIRSSDDKLRIISCSLVVPVKRLERIVEILEHLNGVEYHWTHIGGGKDLISLERLATKRLGKHRVSFVGNVSPGEVKDFYVGQEVDLFINTSDSEGVPVSIMEAFSAGIPVIAPDVGGVSEIVDDKNGWLTSPSDIIADSVAAIIHYTEMSDNQKDQKRDAAFVKYSQMYDAHENAKELANHLIKLIS